MKQLQPCVTDPLSLAQLTPPALRKAEGQSYARLNHKLTQGRASKFYWLYHKDTQAILNSSVRIRNGFDIGNRM